MLTGRSVLNATFLNDRGGRTVCLTNLFRITTLTLLHYPDLSDRFWALTQMQLAHQRLADVPGLTFYRLMGSGGGNGFSLRPNLAVYAWLGQWAEGDDADRFFENNAWFAEVCARTDRRITFRLDATMSHGKWGEGNPFPVAAEKYDPDRPVAVLTRATIHPGKLLDFWRYVPRTSASVYDQPDRLLSLGVGEYPVFMQATFSLWRTGRAMTDFAYRSQYHKEVVQRTRERGWYRDELFARFQLQSVEGEWPDLDMSQL